MTKQEFVSFKRTRKASLKDSREVTPFIRTVSGKELPDPLLVYENVLQNTKLPACLMESATHKEGKGRFSFLCLLGKLLCADKMVESLKRIEDSIRRVSPLPHEFLPFTGGAVGPISYEITSSIEKAVKPHPVDMFRLPSVALYGFGLVIVFDRMTDTLYYVANVPTVYSDERGCKEGERLVKKMERYIADSVNTQIRKDTVQTGEPESNLTKAEYKEMVLKAKRHIMRGDIFQVVLSRRFSAPFDGNGTSFYKALRSNNPSPYLFHMRLGKECDNAVLVGSSPEIMTNIQKGEIIVRPLAGTRKRGKTPAGDKRNELALLRNSKERMEHKMLVDLALHDVRGVCDTGSTKVTKLMEPEYCGYVIHMASEIKGTTRKGVSPFEACVRVSPAGTLSGCPKIKAQQIIVELESCQRGFYGGTFGWFTDYSSRTCIFIRSAMLLNGKIHFQVGTGIVADSKPESEWNETVAKAKGTVRSLEKLQ